MPLDAFSRTLSGSGLTDALRASQIGEGIEIPGPLGPKRLVYADHVASGRALSVVEDFIAREVLPFYANSHTEDSFCGARMTSLRNAARASIARVTRADGCSVIFTGSGATSGLNRLVHLFGLDKQHATPPVVFIGPYEHHSNTLPWRESGAIVIEIPEGPEGGPDLRILEAALRSHADAPVRVGSFSAASNVSGIITERAPVTRLLHKHGARVVWDFAGGGPYLPVDMSEDGGIDAVALSPHKFPGGPGASGVLIVRDTSVTTTTPTWPGGGTVTYVSPWSHDYSNSLVSREEAGTPNVIGDIRAGLVFLLKEAVGTEAISEIETAHDARAMNAWNTDPRIELLGRENPLSRRLPIFSFRIRDGKGGYVDPQLFTRLLSDHYGIQARGGCSCAGSYGHRLLGIDAAASGVIRDEIAAGHDEARPGWTRLNFSWLTDEATARFIITAVGDLATRAADLSNEESRAA